MYPGSVCARVNRTPPSPIIRPVVLQGLREVSEMGWMLLGYQK